MSCGTRLKLLGHGVDRAGIALWLEHESVEDHADVISTRTGASNSRRSHDANRREARPLPPTRSTAGVSRAPLIMPTEPIGKLRISAESTLVLWQSSNPKIGMLPFMPRRHNRHSFCSHLTMGGAPPRSNSGTRGTSRARHDAALHAAESGSPRRRDSAARSAVGPY
jgi:hypothetical protein